MWWRAGRRPCRGSSSWPRRGPVVFAGVGITQARPYLKISNPVPAPKRSDSDSESTRYGPGVRVGGRPRAACGGAPPRECATRSRAQRARPVPGRHHLALAVVGLVPAPPSPRGAPIARRARHPIAVVAFLSLGYGWPYGHLGYPDLDFAPAGTASARRRRSRSPRSGSRSSPRRGRSASWDWPDRRGLYAAGAVRRGVRRRRAGRGQGHDAQPEGPRGPTRRGGAPGRSSPPDERGVRPFYMSGRCGFFPKSPRHRHVRHPVARRPAHRDLVSRTKTSSLCMGIRTVFIHTKLERPSRASGSQVTDRHRPPRRSVAGYR